MNIKLSPRLKIGGFFAPCVLRRQDIKLGGMDLNTMSILELQRLFIELHNDYMDASKDHTFGQPKSPEHKSAKFNLDEVIEELSPDFPFLIRSLPNSDERDTIRFKFKRECCRLLIIK
jgi:hypothetical protein